MNSSTAFCPHCKKDTLFTRTERDKTCSVCGYRFQLEDLPPSVPWVRRNLGWLLFWTFLAAPATLAFLSIAGGAEDTAGMVTFYGSGVSAFYCAIWCAGRTSTNTAARILLGFALFAVFYCVSFGLCFAGCVAAGNASNLFR